LDPAGEAMRHAPATLRNRDAICDVLGVVLPTTGEVLEVASGTGEHIVHFARVFANLRWQPSDYDAAGLASIAAWSERAALPNIMPPIQIDASAPVWPVATADAIVCINMIHIAPWAATEGLFASAARCLPTAAPLYLYGPFKEEGVPTVESNLAFDANLKARNPEWGLRDLADVETIANQYGFALDCRVEMPANNISVVFRRQ
jgi:Protein of unknown function (DUF938)